MDKLELKHLAPYLPYELRLTACSKPMNGRMCELLAKYNYSTIKPILHPLSDLTKEIDHNDNSFVPSIYFESHNITLGARLQLISQGTKDAYMLPWWVISQLFEWHFDVFSLIPAGLAISFKEAGL